MSDFENLDPKNETFSTLVAEKPAWWLSLRDDADLVIEVRKDNTLDVYYNGGCVITGIRHQAGGFTGSMHIKYIPLASPSPYVPLALSEAGVAFPASLTPLPLGHLGEDSKRRIKERINRYYPPTSEKGLQYKLIRKDGCFLDSEFAWSSKTGRPDDSEMASAAKTNRIDLVRVDQCAGKKRILFAEVKTPEDVRLFDGELERQLESYHKFLSKNAGHLKEYFTRVFAIKRSLGILPHMLRGIVDLKIDEIILEPLLVVIGCSQPWIDDHSEEIDKRVRPFAAGAYYFGEPNTCELLSRNSHNRHVFPRKSDP
jgi:hypothetical protein